MIAKTIPVTLSVAFFSALIAALPLGAQETNLDDLFDSRREVGPEAAEAIEGRIWVEWSKSGSPTLDLLLERGREALEAENPALAVEHMTALIDHEPGFAEAYNVRATAYFQQGHYGLSLEDIRMALALNPRHFGAMSGLALILEELGRPEDALAAWREVVEIHPNIQGGQEAIKRLEASVEGTAL